VYGDVTKEKAQSPPTEMQDMLVGLFPPKERKNATF
jgi:hypothetical protein